SRPGWQQGGDSGPAIVPGKPAESLLLQAVRYEGLEMPPAGRLAQNEIAALEKWIAMEAPDPRDKPPALWHKYGISPEEGKKHWAYQTPRRAPIPTVRDAEWPLTEIDRFILARQEMESLQPVG